MIWQPWEFVIIGGSALGIFIMANPLSTVFDTGRALMQAILGGAPKRKDYLECSALLYALMRELRGKPRNEVEAHVDNPEESEIFKRFPTVLKDQELTRLHLRLRSPDHHRQRPLA